MIIYNQTILEFKKRLFRKTKEILTHECKLKVGRSRFSLNGYTYPIYLVVFEHPRHLGFFKASQMTIGINKELITSDFEKMVNDILRHEIAHYLTYIKFGHEQTPHGENFQNTCKLYGWGKDVSLAKGNLELIEQNLTGNLKTQALMSKVKKLLKLGSSNETHEANLATRKANELLLKYNLSLMDGDTADELSYYQKSVLTQKKRDAKLEAIYEILGKFFVKPVFSYVNKKVNLDLFGTKENIEFAEYVAHFLNNELDRMWLAARQSHGFSGLRQKNSFYRGVAEGFLNKEVLKNQRYAVINSQITNKFNEYINGRYASSSQSQIDHTAKSGGYKQGQTLSINPAIKTDKKNLYLR